MSRKIVVLTMIELIISLLIGFNLSHLFNNVVIISLLSVSLIVSIGVSIFALFLSARASWVHSGLNITELRNQRERYEQREARYCSLVSACILSLVLMWAIFVFDRFPAIFFKEFVISMTMFTFLKTTTLPIQILQLKREIIEIESKRLQ